MRIAVTGSTGLIGSHLVSSLRAGGHHVVRLVRRPPRARDEVTWDWRTATVDVEALGQIDAVVHLAGAPIAGRRWTDEYKAEIRDSRVAGTATIASTIAAMDPRPRVLVSGSATGWYGDTDDVAVDESAPAGTGFLPEVVREWEAATAPAEAAGIRVAHARTGVVVAREGGLLAQGIALPGGIRVSLLQLFTAGLGGRIGNGRQWLSWISIEDEVAALRRLVEDDQLSGPVNLTAPTPVRNADFTSALAGAVRRPALIPVPAVALRAVAGGLADDALTSQRVLPRRLVAAGFDFRHRTIEEALAAALAA
jgi:uncharacterized protein (TIGR01777 family)